VEEACIDKDAMRSAIEDSERPVLLAVDEKLGEGATLRVAPELADPVGAVEVGESENMEELGAAADGRASSQALSAASISSKVTGRRSRAGG
jgi:hypothetical protein